MYLLRNLIRRCLPSEELEGQVSAAGGSPEVVSPAPAAEPAPAAAPAPEAAAPAAAPAGPATMLEAISQGLSQPRDELGRFAPKTAAEVAAEAAKAAAQPAAAPAPAQPQAPAQPPAQKAGALTPEDMTPPEGVTPQAQARFQKLANAVKEGEARLQELTTKHEEQIGYIRDTFQRAGIQREQFEQFASLSEMYNRGDYAGYQRALAGELQRVQLLTGQAVQQVDALASFPDLRQAVDNAQITEAHAVEIARSRESNRIQAHQTQQRQQVEQSQQELVQSVKQGQRAVDALCQELMQSDIDYPAIEARMLPKIGALLQGVPPQQWAGVVRTQYETLKEAIAEARRSSGGMQGAAPGTVLRPSGASGTQAAPKTMFDAMWNRPRS